MNALTGIKQELVYEEDAHTGTFVENDKNIFIVDPGSPIFGQLERPVVANFGEFSREKPKDPEKIKLPFRIRVRDDHALPIGNFSGTKEICWVMKKVNGFTSIVYNLPVLPARLLRKTASFAGAHIHLDEDDGLWATRGLLVHHACSGGTKKIKLTDNNDWVDLRTNLRIEKNNGELILNARAGQTSVLGIELDPRPPKA